MVQKVCWNNRYLVEDRYTSQKVERSFRDFLQNLSKSYKASNTITSSNFLLSFLFIEKVVARYRMLRQRGQNLFVSCCLSEMFPNLQRQEATEDCSMLVQRRRSLQFLRSTKPVNIFLIIVK